MTGLEITLLGGLRIRKIEDTDEGRYTENVAAGNDAADCGTDD